MIYTDKLYYETRFMDPSYPSGLWLCGDRSDVQAVHLNACCPADPEEGFSALSRCRDFVEQYPFVLIVCADPEKRAAMAGEARKMLPHTPIFVTCDKAYRGASSVFELFDRHGRDAVDKLSLGAIRMPAFGLMPLSELTDPPEKRQGILSGIRPLDALLGGFSPGELSVWTGRRGEGKSTLLSQLLLTAVDQSFPVCAYSGELSPWRFKSWALLQAAGPKRIREDRDSLSGRPFFFVPEPVRERVENWWNGKFFLLDPSLPGANSVSHILSAFRDAREQHHVSVFLADNLMTARLLKETDYYRAQSEFVAELADFAQNADVCVHLVAHPRKTEQGALSGDDIAGTGDTVNRADNVFSLERLPGTRGDFNACLRILKNRAFGVKDAVGLCFHPPSRRFYRPESGPDFRYSWDDGREIINRDRK